MTRTIQLTEEEKTVAEQMAVAYLEVLYKDLEFYITDDELKTQWADGIRKHRRKMHIAQSVITKIIGSSS